MSTRKTAALLILAGPAIAIADGASEGPVTASLYGFVLLNAALDTGGVNNLDVPLFATSGTQGGAFVMTARQTRLGVKLVAPTVADGAAGAAVVEIDFFGGFPNGNLGRVFPVPRLRLALGTLRWQDAGILVEVGQDWSVLAPLNPVSMTHQAIPRFAAAGNLWHRAPQVRVAGDHGDEFSFTWAAAVMGPTDGEPSEAGAFEFFYAAGAGERSRRPALEARVSAAWRPEKKPRAELGVSGRVGWERYFPTGAAHKDMTAWAAAADLHVVLLPALVLRGEAFVGLNLEAAMGGVLQGVRKQAAPAPATGFIAVNGVHSKGFWAQLSFIPLAWLGVHAGAGMDVPAADDVGGTMRRRNFVLAGAIIASLGARYRAGLEAARYETRLASATPVTWQLAASAQMDLR